MTKRFMVKRFRFETTEGDFMVRYLLTDHNLPLVEPNQYLMQKGINKPETGRVYAYKLAKFFNFLKIISKKSGMKPITKQCHSF